jgi:uncharacterized protein (DUF1800 family)
MAAKFVNSLLAIAIMISIVTLHSVANATDAKVIHVLNRLSLGIRPGDIQAVEAIGVEKYIQQQLNPGAITQPTELNTKLAQLETLKMSPLQLRQEYDRLSRTSKPEERQENRQKTRRIMQQLIQARLLRATESPRQLEEVMNDFWFNHFNVFGNKDKVKFWVGSYEESAIRPNILGRFRDLLEATARHPAMIVYLDNAQNSIPNEPGARGRPQGLNENYARELMELHTLGVNGGYTQQDVVALAKILTGWGIQRINAAPQDPSGFYFNKKRHDFSDKTFLGTVIKGSGEAEVEQALDILANHPATAKHISYKLAQYFVADNPPASLVDQLSQRYLATNGSIREVLKTLFQSAEFWDSQHYGAKFKTPYQYVVSALRSTNTKVTDIQPIVNTLQQLGMPLYGRQSPDGYPNTKEAWLNPDAMNRRLSFVTTLTRKTDSMQLRNTLGDTFSTETKNAITQSRDQLKAALILGSPEFMYR